MANWNLTIHLGDFWRDDSLTFEEKRDLTVKRINESRWASITDNPDFDLLVLELTETLNFHEFDFAFDDLYDQADIDRVWIETIARRQS